MSSSAAKRISRSSRPALHSDKENSQQSGSSENLSEMLKTLGITSSTTSSARKPSTSTSTTSSNTSPMTTRRQTRSSREPPVAQYALDSTPKTRTASNTTAGSASVSASGRSRTVSGSEGLSAPLTAIRRPSQQQNGVTRTPSVYSTPLSAKEGHQRSPRSGSVNNAGTAIRQQRKSSVPPTAAASTTTSSKPRISDEEYTTLIALLAAKEEESTRLRTLLSESEDQLSSSSIKITKLSKEKEGLQSQVTSLNKQVSNSDSAGISKREMERFRKQYEMQESLLAGFQRENEKATVEIEQLKRRERHLTEQLKKIYGPTFSAEIDLPSPGTPEGSSSMMLPFSTTSSSKYGMTSIVSPSSSSRRMSGFGMAPSISSPLRISPPTSFASPPSSSPTEGVDEEKHTQHAAPSIHTNFDPQMLMQQLENVQNLVQRFERRLLSRESELIKKEEEAHEQVKKLGGMVL